MYPSLTWNGLWAISWPKLSRFTKYSVIRKLGMLVDTCRVAASPSVVLL